MKTSTKSAVNQALRGITWHLERMKSLWLSGSAHAGSTGNRRAVIRALRLESSAIQIADVKADRLLLLQQETLIKCNAQGALELRPQQDLKAGACKHNLREGSGGKANGPLEGSSVGVIEQTKHRLQLLEKVSAPAKAALLTGVYILVAGLLLFFAPLTIFTLLFDQRAIAPVWIRIGGVLASLFGFYYLGAAHGDITSQGLKSFYRSTIYGRLFLVVAFTGLVATGKSQWQLLILAAVNLLGAGSMHTALSKHEILKA